MKRKIRFLGPGFRIALIAIALVLVGFMQFIWFSRAAAADVEASYHTLANEVNQTFLREYQRYAPLVANMGELAGNAAGTPDETKKALARIFKLYGPTGTIAGLVASVSVSSAAEPAACETLEADGGWKPGRSAFSGPLPAATVKGLADGRLVFVSGPESNDKQFLLFRAGTRSMAVVEIDTEKFFDTYVKPAVASTLPGATIEWENQRDDGEKSKGQFNPLRTLLGITPDKMRTFRVSVPATMDIGQMHKTGSFQNGKSGDGSEFNYRLMQGGDGHSYQNSGKKKTANIIMPESSTVAAMERRLSFTWFLSVLFLLGIGLAFVQTILQKDKLRAVSEREREFVASVTHELRTPLTAIRSAAHNMRKGLVGAERMAPYGEMIYSQSVRLGSMIEEILLFSQIEGHKDQPPMSVEIMPAELLAELRTPLDEIALSSGIRMNWNFGALPERFFGDPDVIHTILTNLVSNALYHAYPEREKGEIRIVGRISMPDTLQFIVEDDGRGIARTEAKLVFEPFYRDEQSRAKHEKGSGLGLFIARRKAQMIGGRLSLETPYKRINGAKRSGCRFMLELPFKPADRTGANNVQ